MIEILGHWFAAVCGQNPGHTWAPGGILLPCCERCVGLYIGAGVAALLHFALRPKLTGRFLQIHGAFLLVMVPFGFHWVAHGAALRSASGMLFGFGIFTFLWLPLSHMIDKSERRNHQPCLPTATPSGDSQLPLRPSDFGLPSAFDLRTSDFDRYHWQRQTTYFLILLAMLLMLPASASLGGALTAYSLSALAFWGTLALGVLVAGNVSLAILRTLAWLRRLARPGLQP
jgi:hypothetical protein